MVANDAPQDAAGRMPALPGQLGPHLRNPRPALRKGRLSWAPRAEPTIDRRGIPHCADSIRNDVFFWGLETLAPPSQTRAWGTRGGARRDGAIVRTWGAAVRRPYSETPRAGMKPALRNPRAQAGVPVPQDKPGRFGGVSCVWDGVRDKVGAINPCKFRGGLFGGHACARMGSESLSGVSTVPL